MMGFTQVKESYNESGLWTDIRIPSVGIRRNLSAFSPASKIGPRHQFVKTTN
jgi:hypothetical protein